MNSLTENNTFTLSDLPEGKNAVGGRWVYTIKESSTGAKTFKARFVAKGYSQVRGIDFQETFAPTANLTSMHMVAQHNLVLHQMDVKTAYLNAPIDDKQGESTLNLCIFVAHANVVDWLASQNKPLM